MSWMARNATGIYEIRKYCSLRTTMRNGAAYECVRRWPMSKAYYRPWPSSCSLSIARPHRHRIVCISAPADLPAWACWLVGICSTTTRPSNLWWPGRKTRTVRPPYTPVCDDDKSSKYKIMALFTDCQRRGWGLKKSCRNSFNWRISKYIACIRHTSRHLPDVRDLFVRIHSTYTCV